MTGPEASAMAAVSAAVQGPDSPSTASVSAAPDHKASWALALAGPAVSVMLCGVVYVLAWKLWPDAARLKLEAVMAQVVQALAFTAFAMACILGVIVFRLASGGLKRFEAKAGPAGVTLDTNGG